MTIKINLKRNKSFIIKNISIPKCPAASTALVTVNFNNKKVSLSGICFGPSLQNYNIFKRLSSIKEVSNYLNSNFNVIFLPYKNLR